MLINNLEKRTKHKEERGEKILSAKNEQRETPTQEWDTYSRFLES